MSSGGKACLLIRKDDNFAPTREIKRHVRALARNHLEGWNLQRHFRPLRRTQDRSANPSETEVEGTGLFCVFACALDSWLDLLTAAISLSHIMYQLNGFRKSTPPENRQLIVYLYQLKYQFDSLMGELIL